MITLAKNSDQIDTTVTWICLELGGRRRSFVKRALTYDEKQPEMITRSQLKQSLTAGEQGRRRRALSRLLGVVGCAFHLQHFFESARHHQGCWNLSAEGDGQRA